MLEFLIENQLPVQLLALLSFATISVLSKQISVSILSFILFCLVLFFVLFDLSPILSIFITLAYLSVGGTLFLFVKNLQDEPSSKSKNLPKTLAVISAFVLVLTSVFKITKSSAFQEVSLQYSLISETTSILTVLILIAVVGLAFVLSK